MATKSTDKKFKVIAPIEIQEEGHTLPKREWVDVGVGLDWEEAKKLRKSMSNAQISHFVADEVVVE
ncbi:hypothetical protein E2P63_03805 [Candidatus Bathyarchaeota archaeon]|nr:hypothetical protein E2P63_03805 [Candidatus Bathyarchaeota archaeon]